MRHPATPPPPVGPAEPHASGEPGPATATPLREQSPHDEAPHDEAPVRDPRWWHRDHPTFTALAGFYTGLFFVILVPSVMAGILSLALDAGTAASLLPFVLVTLVVPIGLAAWPRTRRFGLYMLLGIVVTLLVVAVVAGVVLWVLVSLDG